MCLVTCNCNAYLMSGMSCVTVFASTYCLQYLVGEAIGTFMAQIVRVVRVEAVKEMYCLCGEAVNTC